MVAHVGHDQVLARAEDHPHRDIEEGSRRRAAVAAVPGGAEARRRCDDPGLVDKADALVARVRDEDLVIEVEQQAERAVEVGVERRAAITTEPRHTGPRLIEIRLAAVSMYHLPGDGGDDAGQRRADDTDQAVAGVRDVHVANGVEGDVRGEVKAG